MSFQSDFRTLITADSSLNTAMSGGIFFENLEDNYDITKDWIVYSFKKNSQSDCLKVKDAYTTYGVTLRIISPSTLKINSLADYLQDYLNGKTQGGIQDIFFIGDSHSADLDRKQYSIVLEFNAFYL